MSASSEAVTQQERARLRAIVQAAHEADGVSPLNESASLIVAGLRPGFFVFHREQDEVLGAAIADPREHTIQAVVTPARRREGIGTRLLATMLKEHPGYTVWAFGTLPAAQALTAKLGLKPARELLQLGRELRDEPSPAVPPNYSLDTYDPSDAEAVVEVNRLAFSHHPEQGKLTVGEFLTLTEQDWFDPAGLLVARQGSQIAGFHWTKRHDESRGEVYVLAVHPDHEGAGLGRALLEAGLRHLEAVGCDSVHLYVEASEVRVVTLYESARFGRITTDTSYVSAD